MNGANATIPLSLQKSAAGRSDQPLSADENEVLEVYRRAKFLGYADITITVQDGKRVKLWLTEKMK